MVKNKTATITPEDLCTNYIGTLESDITYKFTYPEPDGEDVCRVCMSEECEDGNEIVYCDRCGIPVHQVSYMHLHSLFICESGAAHVVVVTVSIVSHSASLKNH
jgi:hypothetical protein